jgi:hypothetical protein
MPAVASATGRARSRSVPFFSLHPGKRATERFWLAYTPVWGTISGLVMLGGFAERWGDWQLMILGVSLALGAVIGPLAFRAPEERGLPIQRCAGFKLGLSVVLFAFLMNYFETPFFWDVLHMHYGFNTRINIENNPVFLYFMTVAYFSTYAVLLTGTFRAARARLADAPRPAQLAGIAVVPFLIAGLETALNANPFMQSLFCYDDLPLMLWFGTFCYGTAFVFALPVWIAIDERPGESIPLLQVVVGSLAAIFANLICLEMYRYLLAPYVTIVEPGANGLRDFGASCLVPLG